MGAGFGGVRVGGEGAAGVSAAAGVRAGLVVPRGGTAAGSAGGAGMRGRTRVSSSQVLQGGLRRAFSGAPSSSRSSSNGNRSDNSSSSSRVYGGGGPTAESVWSGRAKYSGRGGVGGGGGVRSGGAMAQELRPLLDMLDGARGHRAMGAAAMKVTTGVMFSSVVFCVPPLFQGSVQFDRVWIAVNRAGPGATQLFSSSFCTSEVQLSE